MLHSVRYAYSTHVAVIIHYNNKLTLVLGITSKRYSVGLAYPAARGIGAIGQL